LALVALALSSFGCILGDPSPAQDLAIGLTDAGDTVLLVRRCPEDARVLEVAFMRPKGRIGREDDVLIWAIQSVVGSSLERFPLGVTPGEFQEIVPLTAAVSAEDTIAAEVVFNVTKTPARISVETASLNPDSFLTMGGRRLTEDGFRRRSC
jgi:hypothetical protein